MDQHIQLKTDMLDKFAYWDSKIKEDYYKNVEIDLKFENARSSMYETLQSFQTVASQVIFEQRYDEASEKMSGDINTQYQFAKRIESELKVVQNALPKKAE